MILVLLLIFVIFFIIYKNYKLKKLPPNQTPIRFGKKEHRFHLICLLVSFLIILPAILILAFDGFDYLDQHADLIGIVVIIGEVTVLLFVISLFSCIDSYFYLRELVKRGYIIPESKHDYEGIISNLPKNPDFISNTEASLQNITNEGRNKESLILASLSFILSVVIVIITIGFYEEWYFANIWDVLVVFIFAILYWIVSGLVFCRQANNEKYKDRLDLESNKKIRASLGGGLTYVFLMGGFTLLCVAAFMSLMKFIIKNRIATDMARLDNCKYICQEIYDEKKDFIESDWKETYEAMESGDGLDLMELDGYDDLFKKEFLKKKGFMDFREFRESIRINDTHYIITIDDGVISGKYQNEHVNH